MDRTRLLDLISRFSSLRIAVVGDLFLDQWFDVDRRLDEPSLETGLTAFQIIRKRPAAGAAGTVINNLAALGVGKIYAVSLLGDDGDGYEVKKALMQKGVRVEVDDRNETIGKKIRNAQLEKLPYMLVIGENEMNDKTVAVRSRREGDQGVMAVDAFAAMILDEIKEKRR